MVSSAFIDSSPSSRRVALFLFIRALPRAVEENPAFRPGGGGEKKKRGHATQNKQVVTATVNMVQCAFICAKYRLALTCWSFQRKSLPMGSSPRWSRGLPRPSPSRRSTGSSCALRSWRPARGVFARYAQDTFGESVGSDKKVDAEVDKVTSGASEGVKRNDSLDGHVTGWHDDKQVRT